MSERQSNDPTIDNSLDYDLDSYFSWTTYLSTIIRPITITYLIKTPIKFWMNAYQIFNPMVILNATNAWVWRSGYKEVGVCVLD